MGCLPLADLHHFSLTKGFPKNSWLQRHLADQNAIWRYFASIRLCLALLFIVSIIKFPMNTLPSQFDKVIPTRFIICCAFFENQISNTFIINCIAGLIIMPRRPTLLWRACIIFEEGNIFSTWRMISFFILLLFQIISVRLWNFKDGGS